jgi:3-oxoacyl-[acyl-carrier-protein] synthase-1
MSSTKALAITATGLVTPVGLTAAQSCAAFRAKISNPTPTRFIDSGGEWIMAHQVELEQPWRGLTKLAKMAALAIEEALADIPRKQWDALPLLLCVAEADRPGRMAGLDDELIEMLRAELGVRFADESAVVPQGRVGVAVALLHARQLIAAGHDRVLIAATDSLLTWPTLRHYELEDRLLTARNSNGFMPGEGAGALLVEAARGIPGELACTGLGFGREAAHIASEEPLRAEGLANAIRDAVRESGSLRSVDVRVCDVAGEAYYFKEASIALSRTRPYQQEVPELWHPAESIGDLGATSGCCCVSHYGSAAQRAYAPGPLALLHLSNDLGQRAAMTIEVR